MRMLRTLLGVTVAALLLTAAARAQPAAQPSPEQKVLQNMFEAKAVDPAILSPAAAALPVPVLQAIIDGFRAQLGSIQSVTSSGSAYALTFANGTLRASIGLDGQGKIASLVFSDETSQANTAALKRALTAVHVSADWFAPSFLAQLSATQIDASLAQVVAQEGKFVKVDLKDGRYYAVYEKATNPAEVILDAQGRISTLQLGAPAAGG